MVAAEGAGPFDSHVGTLALANALATGVADPAAAPGHRPPRPRRVAPGRPPDALTDG